MSLEVINVTKKEDNNRQDQGVEKEGRTEEGSYKATEAMAICNIQMEARKKIIAKINDMEFCIKLFKDLYKLDFADFDTEEAADHIMHRVLLGTIINKQGEDNRKFIFDSADANIAEIFQKITSVLDSGFSLDESKEKIRSIVDKYLEEKGKLETVH